MFVKLSVRMSHYWSNDVAESSQQGTLSMLQQEFQGHLLGTEEKIGRLQEQIEQLVIGLNRRDSKSYKEPVYSDELEDDYKENVSPGLKGKGLFKDPHHAAFERQRLFQTKNKEEDEMRGPGLFREQYSDNQSLKHLKLTFPVFKEGSDSMEWLRDCEEYFSIYEVADKRRAAIAAMHLTGVPRSWYKSFMIGREGVSWLQFSEAFVARFGELDTDLVFEKFKKLQQTKSVEEYYDEFEKCRGQLLKKIPGLTTEYFLENFVGGLQGEIKGMIRLLEPNNLAQALKLARYYEQTLNSQPKKFSNYGSNYKNTTGASVTSKTAATTTGQGSLLIQGKSVEVLNAKPKPLTFTQKEERRQKGLCYYCDEKFSKGHECKKPQNFLMIAEEGAESEAYTEEAKYDVYPEEEEDCGQHEPVLLSALGIKETKMKSPLQFTGLFDGRNIKLLVDSGSTINLVSKRLCEELDLPVKKQEPIEIMLPNGDDFQCDS